MVRLVFTLVWPLSLFVAFCICLPLLALFWPKKKMAPLAPLALERCGSGMGPWPARAGPRTPGFRPSAGCCRGPAPSTATSLRCVSTGGKFHRNGRGQFQKKERLGTFPERGGRNLLKPLSWREKNKQRKKTRAPRSGLRNCQPRLRKISHENVSPREPRADVSLHWSPVENDSGAGLLSETCCQSLQRVPARLADTG